MSSTTERKLFSYDREEDADIYQLFQKLPNRQHSKYIRIALRLLHEQINNGNITLDNRVVPAPTTTTSTISINLDEKQESNANNDDFEDPSDELLNMGK